MSVPRKDHDSTGKIAAVLRPMDFIPIVQEYIQSLDLKIKRDYKDIERLEIEARARFATDHSALNMELHNIEERRKLVTGGKTGRNLETGKRLLKFLQQSEGVDQSRRESEELRHKLNDKVDELNRKSEEFQKKLAQFTRDKKSFDEKLAKMEADRVELEQKMEDFDIQARAAELSEKEAEISSKELTFGDVSEKLAREQAQLDESIKKLTEKEAEIDRIEEEYNREREKLDAEKKEFEDRRTESRDEILQHFIDFLQGRVKDLVLEALQMGPGDLKKFYDPDRETRRSVKTRTQKKDTRVPTGGDVTTLKLKRVVEDDEGPMELPGGAADDIITP